MALVLALLLALPGAPAMAATASLEPASGPAGSATTVRASGLPAYSLVEVRVAGEHAELLAADGTGRLRGSVQIPPAARRIVPVQLRTEDREPVVMSYRVASRFANGRTVESSDWEGHVLRVATSLDHGALITRVEVLGLDESARISVSHGGRRVAHRSAGGRPRTTIKLKLPGHAAGRPLRVRAGEVALSARLQVPPAVLAAVGDIACEPGEPRTRKLCRHADTAAAAASYRPDAAALLGDVQYEEGRLQDFRASFGPTWGRLPMPMRPVPGNHEYRTPGASGYFEYFAEQASWEPPSWYAYNLGPWHVVALNSNCEREGVGCGAGSEQERWLRAELATSRHRCTLAYWHHPRFSSGFHGSDPRTTAFWRALQEAGADVVLAGHDHDYERFAPQNEHGVADPDGMRSFVAGTGGKEITALREPRAPHSQFGRDTTHGVMVMRLYEDAYSWRFVRDDGKVVDFGNATCR